MAQVLEHPDPTDSTVKALYAHAFTCARPDCSEWLYRQEPGAAAPVLNSRVAHIHARRSNGPRWLDGMTSEENRSAENLLLLCIPHSYEVDEQPTRFPADLLREWRAAQRAEHAAIQQSWNLTDSQAQEVVRESFDSPVVAAPVLAAVARSAERLCVRAEASRPAVAVHAQAWREMRRRTRATSSGWDEDGNAVYAEPSRVETDRYREALLEALADAHTSVIPFAEDLKADVAAARSSLPRSAPWCGWLVDAAQALVDAVRSWPGPPPEEDDGSVVRASAEVRRAADALAGALRGESPSPPPTLQGAAGPDDAGGPASRPAGPEHADNSDGDGDLLQRHLALLEQARPWSRVDHRPYDPTLRQALVDAAGGAATLPPVLATMTFGLDITTALAAAVARNASDETLSELVDLDRRQRPLVVTAALLRDMWRMLSNKGSEQLAQRARDTLVAELRAQDWSALNTWAGCEVCGAGMFAAWAHFDTAEAPREALAAALAAEPARLREVILSSAAWTQRINTSDNTNSYSRSYSELPEWFPAQAVVRVAALDIPDVTGTVGDDDGPPAGTDEFTHLVARVLGLAGQA